MGESGHGFGLAFMNKSKLKKKRKLLYMMVSNFLYSNSILLLVTRTTRSQILLL